VNGSAIRVTEDKATRRFAAVSIESEPTDRIQSAAYDTEPAVTDDCGKKGRKKQTEKHKKKHHKKRSKGEKPQSGKKKQRSCRPTGGVPRSDLIPHRKDRAVSLSGAI
jgi:hypothetical protein